MLARWVAQEVFLLLSLTNEEREVSARVFGLDHDIEAVKQGGNQRLRSWVLIVGSGKETVLIVEQQMVQVLPVASVHAIQDQDQGSSIWQGAGHVVNKQAAPDLFVHVRIARNLLPVEIGKQSHQSGENHTGQVGTKTNTHREVDRGDIRQGK